MNKNKRKYSLHYYGSMLRWSYFLICVCFLFQIGFSLFLGNGTQCFLFLPWLLASCVLLKSGSRLTLRSQMLAYTGLVMSWIPVYVINYGWSSGVQNCAFLLVIVIFFSVQSSIFLKLLLCALMLVLEVLLFFHTQNAAPLYPLTNTAFIGFQLINSVFIFLSLAVDCGILSTNVQDAEKQLLSDNHELQQLANTDPLTGLHNRRYMLALLKKRIASNSDKVFSVAMGDIDFFKKINDSLGHDCGDLVLRELTGLFKKEMEDIGYVCRWGGEEFFFFFPEINMDEASQLITQLNIHVASLPIRYKSQEIHVTMSFGVEEYDFDSSLTALIKSADRKLYYSKEHGRNLVTF